MSIKGQLSLEERLKGIDSQSGDDNSAKSLLQSLKGKDKRQQIIQRFSNVGEEEVIRAVRRLPKDIVHELAKELLILLEGNLESYRFASVWMKNLLKENDIDEKTIEMLKPMKALIERNIARQEALNTLLGPIQFLLNKRKISKEDNDVVNGEELDDDIEDDDLILSPQEEESSDEEDEMSS